MGTALRFLRRHRVLSAIVGVLLTLGAVIGGLTLHARGAFDAAIFSDLPENEKKLAVAALPTVAPGPDGPGKSPTFLVLGSTHLSQDRDSFPKAQVERVTKALAAFQPDLLIVEGLPPDWPRGRGRDYRPDFDMTKYAGQWNLSINRARSVIDSLGHRADLSDRTRCRLGKAYFLTWALANAAYQWTATDCPVTERDDLLSRWFESKRSGEMARIGFPVARANDLKSVVPFDYQGDDAEWFLYRQMRTLIEQWALMDLVEFWPAVKSRYTTRAHSPDEWGSLAKMLRYYNSPKWLAHQYWSYEQTISDIAYDNAGPRQVENYWLRNRKMFAEVEEAIHRRDPGRVMIIVGAGHKYFLDVLVREAGYRWVDPRNYLPGREARSVASLPK